MTDDLSWNSALCVVGINLTKEERATGWPAAFTPGNLARLQYPWGGSASEKKEATKNQSILIATISKAIQNGGLPAVEQTRTEDITESRQVPDFNAPSSPCSGGLGSSYWLNRDQAPSMRTVTKKIGESTVSFFVIERSAFRDWLSKQGVEPSAHVRAWFDSGSGGSVQTGKKADDSESPRAALERVLTECEKRAEKAGEPFDVNDMPGQTAQFWDLCKRLEPVFKRQTSMDSFKRYTKSGRCKWSKSAISNSDSTPLYQKLFPEAWSNDGVVSRKAS